MVSIENKIVQWLQTEMPDLTVSTDVRPNPPDEFVTVERVGGSTTNAFGGRKIFDNASIAVQCWHKTRVEAERLATVIDDIMPSLAYEPQFAKVKRTSFYNFPDETGHWGRYQLIYDVVTHG